MKKPLLLNFSNLGTQRKQLQEYKKTLVLSQSLFEIAVGGLLGDVSIQTQNGGKTYRLKFQQSENLHRDYIFHLHELFDDWVLSPPHFNPKRRMWSFQTISHSEFKKLAHLFVLDENGKICKKHIKPYLVENYATSLSLAYWFMDDGGKSSYNKDYARKGFAFNTQGFLQKEVVMLRDGLIHKFGFDCREKPNKNGFILVISAKSYDIMMATIGEFIIPSMRHKLPFTKYHEKLS